ncbi:TetR/AcrR family transcriptional regulator [Streptomonospora sp. S1-112]|uniref:TetR/AcrR family transcriptional regulator n=1 Tax=Streptomonospora mangrovi TaxID=2883123 RepID=A0A9X3NKP1_9ACTN|nr:TetR/AcrR family transcriptional regulator [Streptomonospora mangrovi]MDA0563836.1 TetR/AcrR family transcriptional regulator [Streptomonospora mangrovi]
MAKRADRPADPLKLIGLLWREQPPAPRSGITTRQVVALAVDLADREGVDAVTIRRVAEEAGVTAMALYPHIGGRSELLELMFDHVAGQTYERAPAPVAAHWRERLEAVARANWAACVRHPWITDLSPGRPAPGPGTSAKYETELRALDGIGLSEVEMDQTLTALLALVTGAARAAVAAHRVREHSRTSDTEWWRAIEPALAAAMGDSDRFPVAGRVSRAVGESTGRANDAEGAYRLGLSLLLDGLAGVVEGRRA